MAKRHSKYSVVCSGRTMSRHRKKSAAKKARARHGRNCRITKRR